MGKRTIIGKYYVERRADGTIKNWVARKASQRRDRLKKSIHKVKSGYGHRGDR
jgi:hypothetical protein